MAERCKARVYGRSFAGIAGSNTAGSSDVCLVSVVCCEVEVSALGRSLVQRSPTDCDVSFVFHVENSRMRRLWPVVAVIANNFKTVPRSNQ